MIESLSKIEIDVKKDIELAVQKYGTNKNEQEICLIDLYSENTKNMMNRDRRITNLTKWSKLLAIDIDAQIKTIEGIEKVRSFNRQNPKFNNNDNDILQKIQSIKLLKLLYEASLFKIDTSLNELQNKSKPIATNVYLNNIQTTYDKFGIPISILKLPSNVNDLTIIYNTTTIITITTPTTPPLPSTTTTTTCSSENIYDNNNHQNGNNNNNNKPSAPLFHDDTYANGNGHHARHIQMPQPDYHSLPITINTTMPTPTHNSNSTSPYSTLSSSMSTPSKQQQVENKKSSTLPPNSAVHLATDTSGMK